MPIARNLIATLALTCLAAGIFAAPQPGERAKGLELKNQGFTLIWGKVKSSSDVDLADDSKSKYTVSMEGSLEAPADLDAVAVCKRFRIRSVADQQGADMGAKLETTPSGHVAYAALHSQVAQVELPRTDLRRDAAIIGGMGLDTDIIVASQRQEVKIPAVVMEDFKEVSAGLSLRVRSLQMSAARELSVSLDYKRTADGTAGTFIEKIYALDPDGKDLGGGRWTDGDPFGQTGAFTAKFHLAGTQVHQLFRLVLVTQNQVRPLAFDLKMKLAETKVAVAGEGPAATPGTAPPVAIPVPTATPAGTTPTGVTPPPAKPTGAADSASPLAAFIAAEDHKKNVESMKVLGYAEAEGLADLFASTPTQAGTSNSQNQFRVMATGKLRYAGAEDIKGLDLVLEFIYTDKAGAKIGSSELKLPGGSLRADRDYQYRQSTALTEPFNAAEQKLTIRMARKAPAGKTRP